MHSHATLFYFGEHQVVVQWVIKYCSATSLAYLHSTVHIIHHSHHLLTRIQIPHQFDTKLLSNGILAWWWFLVLGIHTYPFEGYHLFLEEFFSCLYSCWNWPWHVYQVVIGVPWDNLKSCITVSQLKRLKAKPSSPSAFHLPGFDCPIFCCCRVLNVL